MNTGKSILLGDIRLVHAYHGLYSLPTLGSDVVRKIFNSGAFGATLTPGEYNSVLSVSGKEMFIESFSSAEDTCTTSMISHSFSMNALNPFNHFAALFTKNCAEFTWGFDYNAIAHFCHDYAGSHFHASDIADYAKQLKLVYPNAVETEDGLGLFLPKSLFCPLSVNDSTAKLSLSSSILLY